MTAKEYLQKLLQNCSHAEPGLLDDEIVKEIGLQNFIFKKLTSKTFRKWSIDKNSEASIKKAISINIDHNTPIQFTFPFGGYKLWRLSSAPEVDWAEFFTIAYYSGWIAPILSVYKPGAIFYFSSDDVIIERMDNISKTNTDAYIKSFQKLLTYFRKYFVPNIHMELKQIRDLYTPQEFEAELATHLVTTKTDYEHPDPIRLKKMLKTSELNICWNGAKNLSTLSKADKENSIRMGPIYHDAYGKLAKRRAFVRGEDKIVVFTTPIPNAIALGTTHNSVTKFWTGSGALEKHDHLFQDRILSPVQLDEVKNIPHEESSIGLIDMPNFQKISIYKTRLNFSHQT